VVVVDPGVGGARRPILAAAGGHYFVAPDNGVLTMIYDAAPAKVREISNARLIGAHVSRTFHGRDVFAPAAAHLARGVPPARSGKLVEDYTRFSVLKPVRRSRHVWTGSILKVDRFGNLITNFHIDEFPDVKTRPIELRIGLER